MMSLQTIAPISIDLVLRGRQYWENNGLSFQFIRQTNRPIWDISIQVPFRKFLGQIEFADGWLIINVDRQPYTDSTHYLTYQAAAQALLALTRKQAA
jgi:hypothetical protein